MATFPPHPDRRPAMITGASSGIGAATACALAAAGHPVALGARRLGHLEVLADRIGRDGGEAVALRLDMADPSSIEAFVKDAEAALGPTEVVVSNAGGAEPGDAASTEPLEFERTVQVNLLGAQRLVYSVGAGMLERRRGDLVFITSEMVRAPRPHMAAYVSAKFGLEGLVHALQMELEGTGVRASIVRPGPTVTEMGTAWDPEVTTAVLEDWVQWGFARHSAFLPAESIAAAVLAAPGAPRGTHLSVIEVEPEAPLSKGAS
jgi:NADP-dependent 3-hydroxy acid dehydrogenase YdfG